MRVLILVGTRKGAFVLGSDESRKGWSVSGPQLGGMEVFHLTQDLRDGGGLWAAVNSPIWGAEIQRSHDLGATWQGS
jgi:hypothetical protein